MAKKLSRKQRTLQKQKQQKKLLSLGYKEKELQQISNADLKKVYESNIPQKQAGNLRKAIKTIDRREKEKIRAKKRREKLISEREEKFELLEKIIGTDRLSWGKRPTARWLDSLKLEDLRKGKYKRSDLKEYIPKEKISPIDTFDFNKLHKIPDGKKLHFSFRALNGEKDIGEEIQKFDRYSNEELISYLRSIKEMPQTGTKGEKGHRGKRVGSSGQAGESKISLSSQSALSELYSNEYNADRRANNFQKLLSKTAKKKGIGFQHSAIDYHWQHIRQKDENGRLKAYTEISARKLLVIGNAILWNITERDRLGFYNEFYSICCEIIPDMKNILP